MPQNTETWNKLLKRQLHVTILQDSVIDVVMYLNRLIISQLQQHNTLTSKALTGIDKKGIEVRQLFSLEMALDIPKSGYQ